MARNEISISASPREVFDLLADPRSYGEWVVGSRVIHAADENWPEPGARFDHSVGPRFLSLSDYTYVIASQPPAMLELCARARPMPDARVTLHLEAEGSGTLVTMLESPAKRVVALLIGPLGDALLRVRNKESLRRLKALAEGTAPRPRGTLPRRQG